MRNPSSVKTTDRIFRIVETLQELDGGRVSEVAEALDMADSTVHRHLKSLRENEYVVQEGDIYHVGFRFLNLGDYARNRKELYRLAEPKLEQLAEETNENVQLMIEEHGVGVHVFNTSVKHGISTEKYPVGRASPLHCMAAGKAILAHLDEERLDAILSRDLEAVTEKTITDPEELRRELETIREEGVAFSSEEAVRGIRGIAAPVLDADMAPIGSVNISGPITRVKDEVYREELPQKVLEASNVIEVTIMNEREFQPVGSTD